MEDSEDQTLGQPNSIDLHEQYSTLRTQVVSGLVALIAALVALVLVVGTFNIYLLRQWRSVSKDFPQIRPQAAQLIAGYQKSGPLMDDFVNKLTEYGRTHADFAPILAKYNLRPAGATGAPAATPVSPPAAKPKK